MSSDVCEAGGRENDTQVAGASPDCYVSAGPGSRPHHLQACCGAGLVTSPSSTLNWLPSEKASLPADPSSKKAVSCQAWCGVFWEAETEGA